ncbi:MAG: PAS domain S-box protein [Calditrichaceae bacterium]|nr:PAS domain S-box protein [Calditrichaceae bacterium]MBN2710066.1 PAS domain S-box protein [Calditrichaceae bacterium]RQV94518.1 MAG: PAS domain S-box protein [Calditrichota bacterium]
MISVFAVGFVPSAIKKLEDYLDEVIKTSYDLVTPNCIESLFDKDLSDIDIFIMNYQTCKSILEKEHLFKKVKNIILTVDGSIMIDPDIYKNSHIFDVWDIKTDTVTKVGFSIRNLLDKKDLSYKLNILEAEQKQKKLKKKRISKEKKVIYKELEDFKQAFNYSPCAALIVDPAGNIEYVNPEFTRVTGYTLEESIGKNPRILKSGIHDTNFYKNMWDTLLSGKVWKGDICNKMKDGRNYWERVAIIPFKNNDDIIKYFIAIRVDDMERRKAEEAVKKAEILKTIRELAGSIAHEFSQPLQVLTINTSLLNEELASDSLVQRNEKMIRRITELVENLKNITEIQKKDYLDSAIIDLKASTKNDDLDF